MKILYMYAVYAEVQINVCCFAAVEPTYSYYEKVSEELEKIVHEVKVKEEVKPLSDGKKTFSHYFQYIDCMEVLISLYAKCSL